MNIDLKLKILSKIGFQQIGTSFLSIFGSVWLFIAPLGLFLPNKLNFFGWRGYIFLILFSLVLAIILRFPRLAVSSSLSSPDSKIEIKIGDIFEEEADNIVIGCNDVFDTKIGDIIKQSSVQGQFLERIYNNEIERLDRDIEEALKLEKIPKTEETQKQTGKIYRYPIGTTILLEKNQKSYFLNAYNFMSNDIKVKSNADRIWQSLSILWEKIRVKGNGLEVAIPIIGSDLSRTDLSRTLLAKLIIISFIASSKKEFITKKLTVVVYKKDIEYVDLYELEEFLRSTCF